MDWQWDDVRFFLAVARAGSLSAAARTLGVGHVTVGRRIALLEKQLGVTLLNRNPDGFVTTSAGEAILRQCAAMESAATDLERIVAGHDSLLKGTVRVTCTEALAYQLVAPAIAALRKTHPELRVDLIIGVRSLDIARREADLAVRFARPSASDLICRKLGDVAFALYASKRYLASKGVPKQGHGLADHDLITFTGAPAAMSPFFMGEPLEGVRIALRCDSPFVQLRSAANHGGIAEAVCFLGDATPELVRVWPERPPARRPVWLIMHQDMRRAARIRAVSTAITEAFRRERRVLEQGGAAG
ncbi:LysR family transcriptional regulator [Bradyrhizobium commune]|uniref:LysR family transcriptional regulator n=1 Tax=Bradyrhizobium commune TaxID=83627 RepID=A0A7S9D0Q6_9BRAD|nr:LysR family transcriptional regulator [Bradyrhizobium commune]QPF89030.1 LysR family transcriptional regulator [Bradyrhizobium commune]